MLSKDSVILLIVIVMFAEAGLFFYNTNPDIVGFALICGTGYLVGTVLILLTDRDEILFDEIGSKLELYESESLENVLLIQDYRKFIAMWGIVFISTTDDNKFLDKIRLQDQFSVIHIEDQIGSIYLVLYEIDSDKKWSKLSSTNQEYHLYQINQHFMNFNTVLEQLITGIKFELLTIDDLLEVAGVKGHARIELNFCDVKIDDEVQSVKLVDSQNQSNGNEKNELLQEILP